MDGTSLCSVADDPESNADDLESNSVEECCDDDISDENEAVELITSPWNTVCVLVNELVSLSVALTAIFTYCEVLICKFLKNIFTSL